MWIPHLACREVASRIGKRTKANHLTSGFLREKGRAGSFRVSFINETTRKIKKGGGHLKGRGGVTVLREARHRSRVSELCTGKWVGGYFRVSDEKEAAPVLPLIDSEALRGKETLVRTGLLESREENQSNPRKKGGKSGDRDDAICHPRPLKGKNVYT